MYQAVLKQVSERVATYTGWDTVNATLNGDVLTVECEGHTLLRCNLRNGVILHGQVQNMGLSSADLEDLKFRLNKHTPIESTI